MTRSSLLALLLLPGLASAQDGGETAFNKACARCHQAGAPATRPASEKAATGSEAAQPAPGPDLVALLRSRNPEQLRAWVQAPHQVRPETRCDTRLMEEGELDLILSHLATLSQPPPLPRDEQLRQQLQQDLAERRARKKRQAAEASQPVRVKP